MYTSFLSAVCDYAEELAIQTSVEQEILWGNDDDDDSVIQNQNQDIKYLGASLLLQ